MPTDEILLIPDAVQPGPPGLPDAPGGPPPLGLPPEPEEIQPRRRRRPARTALWALGLLAVGALLWTLLSAFLMTSAIERIPSEGLPSLDALGPGPVNYLLVGTDSREDLSPELGNFFGDFGGERADVIMVLHVAGGRLQMVSLPRDLRVDIPDRGSDRINAAYAYGGPDLLVATVKQATGLPIHHYLEVRFGDFAGVVDALGGVAVEFPYDARDGKSGLTVAAGTGTLDGPQAVAYVRSRSYEELRDGSWVAVDQGDIARTARQQLVIDQLLASATSPARIPSLPFVARSLGNSLRADAGLSTGTLLKLGLAVARARVTETATLPTRNAPSGGVAYLAPIEPGATVLLQSFGSGESMVPAG